MLELPEEAATLERLMDWGGREDAIRAMLLTSSRTRPDHSADRLSDYDVVVVVTDAFDVEGDWPRVYGEPLARWGDEAERKGARTKFWGIVYADGVKIDYSFWPTSLLRTIVTDSELPDDLDVGYRVLLDKDGVTEGLRPPSYQAHVPLRPTEATYRLVIEEFWWQTTYVAKALWRGDVFFAKWVLDADTKLQSLRRLLEWKVQIQHDWTLKMGVLGRGLERTLPPETVEELRATYGGCDPQENWEALDRTIVLFRKVAKEVAGELGFFYPETTDERMIAYLEKIRALSPKTDD